MLICWSGGADSTLLLAERLKAAEPVRTLSIVGLLNLRHNDQQRQARKKILAHYKDRKITWPHVEVIIDHHYPAGYKQHIQLGGVLPGIWLAIACAHLDQDEELGIGFIKGDNAIHWLGSIEAAFAALQAISSRTGVLRFPLEWLTKAQVLVGLKQHRLYGKIWWCEAPVNGRRCGRCAPCCTHATAQLVLKHRCDHKLHGQGLLASTVGIDKEK